MIIFAVILVLDVMIMRLMIIITPIFAPYTYMTITAETETKTVAIIRGIDSASGGETIDDLLDDESTTTMTTTVSLP
jgi:hypothetical protein